METNQMTFKGKVIYKLLDRHDHDVFTSESIPENIRQKNKSNDSFQTESPKIGLVNSFINIKSSAKEVIWHQRLDHLGPELIKHIESDTVKIEKSGPKTNEWENCVLNKATKVISRRPSERPKN